MFYFLSDRGDVFGWGNSEYSQLSSVAGDDTQVNTSRHLPFTGCGKVIQVAAAGSTCAFLNGKRKSWLEMCRDGKDDS